MKKTKNIKKYKVEKLFEDNKIKVIWKTIHIKWEDHTETTWEWVADMKQTHSEII